ncbi:MAG: VOC family protein [Candidatus Omnitrophota bacterium]
MIKNFRHACIIVGNLEKSLKFYRDILGFKVSKVLTVEGKELQELFSLKRAKLTYVKLHTPGQSEKDPPVFELHYWHTPPKKPRGGFSHISFTVDGLNREYKRLKKIGVKFISGPKKVTYSHSRICFGYDPDHHLIEFIEDLTP